MEKCTVKVGVLEPRECGNVASTKVTVHWAGEPSTEKFACEDCLLERDHKLIFGGTARSYAKV